MFSNILNYCPVTDGCFALLFCRRAWLVDKNRIATKILSASDPCPTVWNTNPTRHCPNCRHVIDNSHVLLAFLALLMSILGFCFKIQVLLHCLGS